MKINYPVKYAAMPIIEQVGWSPGLHDLEREYDVVCFIVSKCYLIKECKNYKENGHVVKEYEVVFPYHHESFNRYERENPTYNIYGPCTNSNKVDEIFESYEEALNYVTIKNNELGKKTWVYLPYSENYMKKVQAKKDEFNLRLSKYKLLEQQILLSTEDMVIGKNKELSNVIKIDNNNAKICSANIYEVLNLFDDNYFDIYSISQGQYDNLINLIKTDKFNDKNQVLFEGHLVHNENGILLNHENNEYIGLSFYTTESIQDILSTKKEYVEIDLNKKEGPVLTKQKKI